MVTYKVVANDGRSFFICAYIYSDAFQQATTFCGNTLLQSMDEV